LAQQEGSRDFRIQKRGRRLYRLAGACELSHLPMCFLALFPNGIERQIWRQSLRIHNTVQNGRFARPERALEGGCEVLGAHNTLCATTKRHTVVCSLYMERAIAYLRVSTQQQRRSGLGIEAQRAAIERFANSESLAIAAEFVNSSPAKGRTHLKDGLSSPQR